MGNSWRYEYTDTHDLRKKIDPLGSITEYQYNIKRQVTKVSLPLQREVTNQYNTEGQLTSSTDAMGNTTYYTYNTLGYLVSVEDSEGHTTSYEYDEKGRQISVTDPSGEATEYEYDDLDRVLKTTFDNGSFTQTEYSCCSKMWEQDLNGYRTYYVYDLKKRLYKTISSSKSAKTRSVFLPGGTTISLDSVEDFPANGKVVIGDEIIEYTQRNTANNTLSGLTRFVDGTVYSPILITANTNVGLIDTVIETHSRC